MLSEQILSLINKERLEGKTDEQIKIGLIGLGFNITEIEKFIHKVNNPNFIEEKDDDSNKHHYLGSIIFFIIITVIGLFVNQIPNPFESKYFIIGILTVSLACTIVYSLVSFIIRKISARFGKFWEIILWVLVLTTLAVVIWY